MRKRRILCFASHYLPGFKGGGPVRSLANLFGCLTDEFEYRVLTRNHDLGDSTVYPGRVPHAWYPVGPAQVRYLNARQCLAGTGETIRDWRPDLLYFNSVLDPVFSITPLVLRRLGVITRATPVLVAPRGEFSPGALAIKSAKKSIYLAAARGLGLFSGVSWHATSVLEVDHIQGRAGKHVRVFCAPNVSAPHSPAGQATVRAKGQADELRLVFFSRISPKKNLDGALEILRGVRVPVQFDVYGTQEDPVYWEHCRQLIGRLPPHVRAEYRGPLAPDDVLAVLGRYDAFLFPTKGENFGHVILEALMAGCPVILSDQTPWHEVESSRAGVVLPLDQTQSFRAAIEKLAAMSESDLESMSRNARELGMTRSSDPLPVQATRSMFRAAMGD